MAKTKEEKRNEEEIKEQTSLDYTNGNKPKGKSLRKKPSMKKYKLITEEEFDENPLGEEGDEGEFEKTNLILKIDEEKRIVTGVVLVPEEFDKQGDIISREDIEEAAYGFMLSFQAFKVMHKQPSRDLKVVESYLAPADVEIGGTKVTEGSWVLSTKVLSDELWAQVKKGEFKGYSIGGKGMRVPVGSDGNEIDGNED